MQSDDGVRDQTRLTAAGVLGSRLDPLSWGSRKFALDIDGNSNAWTNLFTRLLLGCCVLKVASRGEFRQWYYAALQPFEHYVPVAADLSDLESALAWCRTHDRECADIAERGYDFARRRTYESELAAGVRP